MHKQSVLNPIMFLSYSSKDRNFVERLAKDLSRSGVTVWYDQWMMGPSDRLRDKINRGIKNCKYFGIVISKTSLKSSWVQNELDSAMIRFIEDKNVSIVPILIENIEPQELPPDIRGFIYSDFRNDSQDQYRSELSKLVGKITELMSPEEPLPVDTDVLGPKGKPLEEEFLAFATDAQKLSYTEEDIVRYWPQDYCRKYRSQIFTAVDRLLFVNYNDPCTEDVIGLFFALLQIHQMKTRQIPNQMLRIIDDYEYPEEVRAVTVHLAGLLDYPLGENRIIRILSEPRNKVIYSICEYLEYRVGLIDSEEIAVKLLAIVNRPDSIAYFTAEDKESGEEIEADIRYYAARCLIYVDLPPSVEMDIVAVLRNNFPEIEAESVMAVINSIALGALYRQDSRLWKRYSGNVESIFDRNPEK